MLVNELTTTSQAKLPLEHSASRHLYRYWEAARGAQAAPTRTALDLKAIAPIVSHLAILEQRHPGGDFTWRLAGTGVCDLLGREATGTRMARGLDAFEADVVHRFLRATTEQMQPCVFKLRLVTETGQTLPVEFIGLPIQAHDQKTIHVLVGMFPLAESNLHQARRLKAIRLLAARCIWTEHLPGDALVTSAVAPPRFQIIDGGKR